MQKRKNIENKKKSEEMYVSHLLVNSAKKLLYQTHGKPIGTVTIIRAKIAVVEVLVI